MKRNIWGILTAVLGLNLWFALCLLPLQIEWQAPDTRLYAVAVDVLPLLLLTIGAVTRWPSVLLMLFPASFISVYLLLSDLDQRLFTEAGGWLSLGISLLLYVVGASMWAATRPVGARRPGLWGWLGEREDHRDGRELMAEPMGPPPRRRDLWWPYRLHFWPRWVALLLLLVVPLYSLNFAGDTAAAYAKSYGEQAAQAQVMANLVFLFIWVVVAFLFFLSPGLNLELEQRALDEKMQRLEDRKSSRSMTWMFMILSLLAVGLMVALIALRLF